LRRKSIKAPGKRKASVHCPDQPERMALTTPMLVLLCSVLIVAVEAWALIPKFNCEGSNEQEAYDTD
jgi:hypothetical protein